MTTSGLVHNFSLDTEVEWTTLICEVLRESGYVASRGESAHISVDTSHFPAVVKFDDNWVDAVFTSRHPITPREHTGIRVADMNAPDRLPTFFIHPSEPDALHAEYQVEIAPYSLPMSPKTIGIAFDRYVRDIHAVLTNPSYADLFV